MGEYMPLLRNPSGVLVVVPASIARELLFEYPTRQDIDGKIKQQGFSVATEEEKVLYAKQVRDAAKAIADQEAAELAKREANSFAIAKGLLSHLVPKGKDK